MLVNNYKKYVLVFKIYLSISIFLLSLISSRCHANDSVKNMDIYLLIGQSNMAGRAPIPDALNKAIEGVYILNDKGKWIPAKPPLNIYSTIRKAPEMQKLNPGVTFAQAMHNKYPDKKIGLVVNAKGGSDIKEWENRDTLFYKEALKRLKLASENGNIRGILWHQGEANWHDKNYITRLSRIITHFREDLNMPRLPFIAGQINNNPKFNNRILTLPDHVPFTAVCSTKGLKAMDLWHFDTPSMLILGKRYAECMISVQEKLRVKNKP